MMSLPFFAAALAIVAGWYGRPAVSAWLVVLAVAITLALFAMHATSSLNIDL